MNPNLTSQLDTAIQELRDLLAAIDSGQIPDKFTVTPQTEQLTHFNRDFQARKVATTVIEPDELRQAVRADTASKLVDLLAISDELRYYPVDNLQSVNFDRADARYSHKTNTAYLITHRYNVYSDSAIEKENVPQQLNAPTDNGWIPLQALKGKSASELTRMLLRAVVVDEQLDSDISDLFAGLLQGAETDPDILPTVEQSGLDRSYDGLRDLSESQPFRDATGPVLATLLESLVANNKIEAYEEPFRTAYDATIQFVTAQALATPKTAEQLAQQSEETTTPTQPTPDNVTPSATAPFVTPATLPPAGGPISTSAPATPPLPTGQADVDNQALPTGRQAPTVDFRHPTAPPPMPPPSGGPSKVKPLNLP